MAFQQSVGFNYTQGFVGQIIYDGPLRIGSYRLDGQTVALNTIGRAFGYSAEYTSDPGLSAIGSSPSLIATVGGANFCGMLVNPDEYELYGTATGGPLAPSYSLPPFSRAQLMEMGIAVAEIFNPSTGAAATVNFGDALAYVTSATTAAQNPAGIPLGGIVNYPAGGTVPAGFTPIPNSRVKAPATIAQSGAGAPSSQPVIVQFTQ
jgi:hypothetical protein